MCKVIPIPSALCYLTNSTHLSFFKAPNHAKLKAFSLKLVIEQLPTTKCPIRAQQVADPDAGLLLRKHAILSIHGLSGFCVASEELSQCPLFLRNFA